MRAQGQDRLRWLGEIKKICPDSGDFQPGDVKVMALLQMLRMRQVPLERLIVQNLTGQDIDTAAQILSRRDWSEVVSHMKENQKTLKANRAELKSLTTPKPISTVPDNNADNDHGQTPASVGQTVYE